jgi:site-specific DNA-methyltransferase (adenine-specific)
MEAYIQVRLDETFLLLNKIVWYKTNNLPQKNAHLLRTFAPMTERALFYTVQQDETGLKDVMNNLDLFKPIRDYFDLEHKKCKLSYKEINEKCFGTSSNGGGMASNILTTYKEGWTFPTQEKYEALQRIGICQKPYNELRQEYETLRQEYETLRQEYEALRRPFNADSKTFDVIEWPIIGGDENTEHPTTKPLGLCVRILSVIASPGQTVLDCCMGSGTSLVACEKLGLNSIGIEIDSDYFAIAKKRIERAALQEPLFT